VVPTRELAQRLAEAEATIQALLSGQIDAVVDSESHTPVLLAKAQEALRDSEERYRRIVETTNEGIGVLDTAATFTFVNHRFAEMLGYTPAELIGKSLFLVLPQPDQAAAALRIEHSRQGVSEEGEVAYVTKHGSTLWTLLRTSPIRGADGTWIGTLGMITDRTRQREADEALRKSTADLRDERDRAQRYLDTAEIILLALDAEGRITLANRYACNLLGWTAQELVGRDWIDTCLPPRIRDALRQARHNLLGGDLSVIQNPVLTKAGEERLIEWRNTLLRDDDGHVTGTFSSGTDITERNQAVEALRTAEERMRFALTSANVGIWDMDYKVGLVRWSEILESQYGLLPGTFRGTFEAFAEVIHPEDRESVLGTIGRAMELGGEFSVDHRTIRPDGSVRWLSGAGRVLLGEDGTPIRAVGISQDVTERRTLELQYQQAQKMEAVGQLASGVAHDFNNLLTVILGCAEILTEDSTVTQEQREELGEIIKAARRAAGLTKQLLAFGRQQVLHTASLDVNMLITDMAGMLGRLIGEDMRVELELAPGLRPALADRGQLEQVVMNLVVNARDAMPGGGTVTLHTANVELENSSFHESGVVQGHYVMLAITDTGTGMSKETQQHLFEPFFTTKERGKGTGLGLSTAYGIIKQSKGHIWVYSELGKGTTFKVFLPCADSAASVPAVVAAAAPPVRRASETVLLVEDEVSVRRLSKRILEHAGFRVLEAANGDEAEQLYAQSADAIDLVVTDVIMPGCGGPELLRRLQVRAPALRVLYMSGYTEQSVARNEGFDSGLPYVQKPFTAAEFVRRVREALDR